MAITKKSIGITTLVATLVLGGGLLVNNLLTSPVTAYENKALIDSLNKEATKVVFVWKSSVGRTIVLAETGANEMWYPNGIPGALPGDKYIIKAKHYSLIEIRKTKGTRDNPITFINDTAGQVVCDAFRIKDDNQWIFFDGTGSNKVKYGFKSTIALEVFKHIRIRNFELAGGNIGMFVRQVPDSADRRTYYVAGSPQNYTWEGLWVENCWAHNNDGEAFYIMSTSSEGNDYAGKWMIPARGDSVLIENNQVDSARWDGIQCANTGKTWIRFNKVHWFGLKNMGVQQAGGIIGNGATGYVFGNSFINGTGNGFQLLGNGFLYCAYNTIDSSGRDGTATGQHSVLAQDLVNTVDAWATKQKVIFFRNIIKNPQSYGAIKLYADNANSLPAILDSNNFIIPGAGSDWQTKYVFNNVPNSSFIGNNLNGVTDIPPPPTKPIVNAGKDTSVQLPLNGITLHGSASGNIVTWQWTQISGATINTGSKTQPDLLLSFANTPQGNYNFKLTATDDKGQTGSDTMLLVVKPVVVPVKVIKYQFSFKNPSTGTVVNVTCYTDGSFIEN